MKSSICPIFFWELSFPPMLRSLSCLHPLKKKIGISYITYFMVKVKEKGRVKKGLFSSLQLLKLKFQYYFSFQVLLLIIPFSPWVLISRLYSWCLRHYIILNTQGVTIIVNISTHGLSLILQGLPSLHVVSSNPGLYIIANLKAFLQKKIADLAK